LVPADADTRASEAFGRLSSDVTALCGVAGDVSVGVGALAFTSASLDPPLVVVCLVPLVPLVPDLAEAATARGRTLGSGSNSANKTRW